MPEVLQGVQRVDAVVLERRLGEVLRPVIDLMIDVCPVDGGEVQPLNTGLLEWSEVGVSGHSLVDLVRNRIRHRVGVERRQRADDPAVLLVGLEHDRGTTPASHLDGQNERDVGQPRVLVHERARAQQPQLLGVRQQHDHIVA